MSFRDKVNNSKWIDDSFVTARIADNARKAAEDRQVARKMALIAKNRTRTGIARVAK
jgi:hypothetical protein